MELDTDGRDPDGALAQYPWPGSRSASHGGHGLSHRPNQTAGGGLVSSVKLPRMKYATQGAPDVVAVRRVVVAVGVGNKIDITTSARGSEGGC